MPLGTYELTLRGHQDQDQMMVDGVCSNTSCLSMAKDAALSEVGHCHLECCHRRPMQYAGRYVFPSDGSC